MLHAERIHDLFLTVSVSIKVTRHNIDYKNFFLICFISVVLLILTIGGNLGQKR